MLATWFPQHERARANSIYSLGQYIGLAFLSVPLFWVAQALGWRMLFFAAGGLGILVGLVWWVIYREPRESATVNAAEIAYIEAGGGGEYRGEPLRFRWAHIGWLLRHRQILAASLGQFGGNSTQVFFVTWFPTYLVTARGMGYMRAGIMASLPYIGASVGVLVAGQLSDWLLKRTGSANLARKVPIVTGMILASSIITAIFIPVGRDGLVIAVMSIAFFGQGMTNLGWTVISDVAPKRLIGLTSGIFNFSANVAGIVTPLVIGVAYQVTGSFAAPLVYIGVVALIGAFAYGVLLGDIRRLEFDE